MKKLIKVGAAAEKHLKKLNLDKYLDENSKSELIIKKQIKIVKKLDDGTESYFRWEGTNEVPEDIISEMKNAEVWINIDISPVQKQEDLEKEILIKVIEGDEEKTLYINSGIDQALDELIDVEPDQIEEIEVIKGEKADSRKAQLGVNIEDAAEGVRIISLIEGSAAQDAKLLEGDIITDVNNEKVQTMQELVDAIKDKNPGETVRIGILRKGNKSVKTVTLEAFNAEKYKQLEKKIIIKMKK